MTQSETHSETVAGNTDDGGANNEGKGAFALGFRSAATKRVEALETRLNELEAARKKTLETQQQTNSSVLAIQAKVDRLETSATTIANNLAELAQGLNAFQRGMMGMKTLLTGVARSQIKSGAMSEEEVSALAGGLITQGASFPR